MATLTDSCLHLISVQCSWQLMKLYISYLFLFSLCFLGVPLCIRSKISAENLMPWHFPVLSSSFLLSCCCVAVCSKGGCLFVGACCVLFVVMVSFNEASVYIPPLKIEPLFGNTTADSHVTCMHDSLLPNLFLSFYFSFSFFPSSSNITSSLQYFSKVWSLFSS